MSNKWSGWKDDHLVEESGKIVPEEGAKTELSRRLMESINKLDKTTSAYSERLLHLSLILLLVALAQLMVSIFSLNLPLQLQLFIWLALMAYIVYESRRLTRK